MGFLATRAHQQWLDDTHPQMSANTVFLLQQEQVAVTKLTCKSAHLKLWPPVPGFERGWLAGCLVSGVLIALQKTPEGRKKLLSDMDQCEHAFRDVGFTVLCARHNFKEEILRMQESSAGSPPASPSSPPASPRSLHISVVQQPTIPRSTQPSPTCRDKIGASEGKQ